MGPRSLEIGECLKNPHLPNSSQPNPKQQNPTNTKQLLVTRRDGTPDSETRSMDILETLIKWFFLDGMTLESVHFDLLWMPRSKLDVLAQLCAASPLKLD